MGSGVDRGGVSQDMCGIVGVVDRTVPRRDELLDVVVAMSRRIAHRGPDDSGEWLDVAAGVALGHRRLAVLDLTSAGHQPMVSRDGRYVLAFNGEIYNHHRLRRLLLDDGVTLAGRSDTEALLAALARWPLRHVLGLVDGMFAFALYDAARRCLTLARDRMGEKPLYFTRSTRGVAFASELPALAAVPWVSLRLSASAVAAYLRHSFVPAPASIFDGVEKLLPGHVVTFDGDSGGDQQPYWTLPDADGDTFASPVDAVDQLDEVLRAAVAGRIESDVPLGAFLSGGVDSSLVVALMQQVSRQPVRTFTVAIGPRHLDESTAARAVARHLGTAHTDLALSSTDALDIVPDLAARWDEPFADPSAVPTALMCRAAREHVTVCLSGDGGDELFGGYNRYALGSAVWGRARRVPYRVRREAGRVLDRVPARLWDVLAERRAGVPAALRAGSASAKMGKLAKLVQARTAGEVYDGLTTVWDPATVLLDRDVAGGAARDLMTGVDDQAALEAVMRFDCLTTLPDDMLVKVDRASMAVALECRVPLLALDVVEFAARLPTSYKIRDGAGKWILRQVLRRYVPDELTSRPKLGFDPPVAQWLRGPLADWAEDLLAPGALAATGLLDPGVVRDAWRRHRSGAANLDYPLWTVLCLQSWLSSRVAVAA